MEVVDFDLREVSCDLLSEKKPQVISHLVDMSYIKQHAACNLLKDFPTGKQTGPLLGVFGLHGCLNPDVWGQNDGSSWGLA